MATTAITTRPHRTVAAALAATAAIAAAGISPTPAPVTAPASAPAAVVAPADVTEAVRLAVTTGPADVVVRAAPATLAAARAAVTATGGTLGVDLELIGGFAATIDAAGLELLEAMPGVIGITLDSAVEFLGKGGPKGGSTDGTADTGTTLVEPYDHYYTDTIGAEALKAAGVDGSGVGIAIIDTGIADIADLAGRVVHHEDLSADGDAVDGVGHGTFLAGLAAGDGSMSQTGGKRNPSYPHQGVAPGAHLIDVKVATASGETNLITILAALQWVHHHADQYDIDVVNLSFGTVSEQSTNIDPLNYAVQRLWDDGIVVVVAAGNLGEDGSRTITKPADDPFVITVGSSDSRGTVLASDDLVPTFSSGPRPRRRQRQARRRRARSLRRRSDRSGILGLARHRGGRRRRLRPRLGHLVLRGHHLGRRRAAARRPSGLDPRPGQGRPAVHGRADRRTGPVQGRARDHRRRGCRRPDGAAVSQRRAALRLRGRRPGLHAGGHGEHAARPGELHGPGTARARRAG